MRKLFERALTNEHSISHQECVSEFTWCHVIITWPMYPIIMSRHFRCLICKRQWRIIWWLYKSILYIELINYSSCFSRTLAYFWKTALFYSGSFIRIIISALLVRWLGKDSNKRLWTNKTGNSARNDVASEHILWKIWPYFDPGIVLRWILWHIVWLYWWFWRTINLSRRRRIACCLWSWFLVSSIVLTQISNWLCYHSGLVPTNLSVLIRKTIPRVNFEELWKDPDILEWINVIINDF